MIGRTVYGESQPNAEAKNLRGKVVQLFDQAGVVTSDEYDFKGNLLASRRQLAREYKTTLDWSTSPELEPETFTGSTTYDALNRPLSVTLRTTVSIARRSMKRTCSRRWTSICAAPQLATPFVTDIDYDAKGQRVLIEYDNGVRTDYEYDPLTFRLRNLKTSRTTDHARLQDLSYTYDPVGNITHIRDDAQQTIYFNNQVVSPNNDYTYDAIYRLITAKGREHIGQVSQPRNHLERSVSRQASASQRWPGHAPLHRTVRVRRGRQFPATDPPSDERQLDAQLRLQRTKPDRASEAEQSPEQHDRRWTTPSPKPMPTTPTAT